MEPSEILKRLKFAEKNLQTSLEGIRAAIESLAAGGCVSMPEENGALRRFCDAHVYHINGVLIEFQTFYDKFKEFLPAEEREAWTRIRVSRSLPPPYMTGTWHRNVTHVINASFDARVIVPPNAGKFIIGTNRRIKRQF